jgi:hypothetical protein
LPARLRTWRARAADRWLVMDLPGERPVEPAASSTTACRRVR